MHEAGLIDPSLACEITSEFPRRHDKAETHGETAEPPDCRIRHCRSEHDDPNDMVVATEFNIHLPR
jgi:hypothetical protein